jgi:hypothetical protein
MIASHCRPDVISCGAGWQRVIANPSVDAQQIAILIGVVAATLLICIVMTSAVIYSQRGRA